MQTDIKQEKKSLHSKTLWGFLLSIILCIFTAAIPVQADTSRLSVDKAKLWINSTAAITCTMNNRTSDEELNVTSKKSYVKVKIGEWENDTLTITVTPKKTGTTTLTISCGDEKCTVTLYLSLRNELSAEEVYIQSKGAMVEITSYDSNNSPYVGSGFFIGSGLILTNYHVVETASSISIKDYNGKVYKIREIMGYDTKRDLILIRVTAKNKHALLINDTTPEVGETIYTLGSPLGMTGSFSDGIISYVGREIEDINYLQMTAPTSIGSGGGPMINRYGEVVGVTTLTINSAQNLNFSLPMSYYTDFISSIPADTVMSPEDFYNLNSGKVKMASAVPTYNIDDKSTSDRFDSFYQEKSATDIYSDASKAMVDIITTGTMGAARGSGFFINEDTIVTNYHVINNDFPSFKITDYNGSEYKFLEFAGTDAEADVAVLKVASTTTHGFLSVNDEYIPSVGESIYTIGSPYDCSGTFSDGIVSMSRRNIENTDCIQIVAPISSGNSGGPLINKYGQVIGINSMTLINGQNLNLAIMIKYINQFTNLSKAA